MQVLGMMDGYQAALPARLMAGRWKTWGAAWCCVGDSGGGKEAELVELQLPAGEGGAGAGLGAQPLTWSRSGVCAVLVCAAGLGLRSTEGAAFAGPQHSLGLGLLWEQCSSAAMPALCTRDPWGFLVPTTAEQGGAACHLPSQPGVCPRHSSASSWAQHLLPGPLLAVQHKPAGPERATGLGAGVHGQGHCGVHPG